MKKTLLLTTLAVLLYIHPLSVLGYNLQQISNQNGLSNSAVVSLCQDEKGLVWIGTCDGLNIFNSRDIQRYSPIDETKFLLGNLIDKILEAEPNVYWVQTYYGLNRLDRNHNVVDHFKDIKKQYFIEKDKNNTIFIIKENNSVYYYHSTKKTIERLSVPKIIFKDVLDFVIDAKNQLCIFTKEGTTLIYRIESNSVSGDISLALIDKDTSSAGYLSCFNDDERAFVVDSAFNLYEYNTLVNERKLISNLEGEIKSKGEISSIIRSGDDYFIGFKTNGLIQLKFNWKDANYIVQKIDINCGVFCLLKDKYQDIVWIGTDGQGVYMYSNTKYSIKSTVLKSFTRKMERPVRCLLLDKDNTLWIGSKGDGILKIYDYNVDDGTDKVLEHISTQNSELRDNSVYAFAKSKQNILWIGNEEGLNYYSYKEKRIKRIELKEDQLSLKYIHGIYEDNNSTLWIASVGMGIIKARISGSKDAPLLDRVERFIINDADYSSNYVFSIYPENDSIIWFANRGYGAFRINTITSEMTSINFHDKFKNQTLNDIFTITQDKQHNFMFGTSLGLIKFRSKDDYQIFNEKDGFMNNTIHNILEGRANNYWMSTNRGVINFNSETETFQAYGLADNLSVIEFSDGAAFKDEKSGLLFFGGINGFITIKSNDMETEQYMPPIYFDNLSIFGKECNIMEFMDAKADRKILSLAEHQNFFSISFTAIDNIYGNNYAYSYRMEGVSDQWIYNDQSNVATFTNLAPGKYILHVKYSNKALGYESQVYSLEILIEPLWYKTTLAYLIYLTLIAGIIGYFIRGAIRKSERERKRSLEKLEIRHQKEVHESRLHFFTNVAQEFCTPLTLIYGPCNRILSHKDTNPYVREYTQVIQRNAERLNDLIQELFEFRRIETGNRQPSIEAFEVNGLMSYIENSFADLAKSQEVDLSVEIEPSLIWNSDKGFLLTIISNFVFNAFLYTDRNKTITIDVKSGDVLSIRISQPKGGITKEEIEQFSDWHKTLDEVDKPKGNMKNALGVALAYKLAHLLDGTIEVSDSGENELVVAIRLQSAKIDSPEVSEESVYPELKINAGVSVKLPAYPIVKDKATILIIDEDIETLWLICETFVDEYNVIPLESYEQTQTQLEAFHPNIIICGSSAEGEFDFVQKMKTDKGTVHIPIILISPKQEMEEQIRMLSIGAEMYIPKPFNIDYLKVSVNQLMSRKEILKDYFNSAQSAYDLIEGKLVHKESQRFIKKIVEIINDNISNRDLSPHFIASEMGFSTRHLYRKMNEFGENLSDMIKESKLHVATNLLMKTKMTIDEIMYKSGFVNKTTFYKTFDEKFQCTPKEYRDRNRGLLDNTHNIVTK